MTTDRPKDELSAETLAEIRWAWGWHDTGPDPDGDEVVAGWGHHMAQMLYRLPRDAQTDDMKASILALLDHAEALTERLAEARDDAASKARWIERAKSREDRREAELAALRAQVEAVRAIHRPIRVYDECDHDECPNDPIEVYDYIACKDSQIGWGCTTCCYDDEYPREDCPHGADHRGVTREQSCPTHAALATPGDTPTEGGEGR